jgi:hypothetical protein
MKGFREQQLRRSAAERFRLIKKKQFFIRREISNGSKKSKYPAGKEADQK